MVLVRNHSELPQALVKDIDGIYRYKRKDRTNSDFKL